MIKLIVKGVLLYMTTLSIILFLIGGFESLVNQDEALIAGFWFTINVALLYICKYNISYKEVYILSGTRWIERVFKE